MELEFTVKVFIDTYWLNTCLWALRRSYAGRLDPMWWKLKKQLKNLPPDTGDIRDSEKAMTPHSSTLAWKIPWTEEPGRLQSMWSLRVGHDWATSLSLHFHALEKEMATHSNILAWRIPGTEETSGLPSMGSHRVWHDWSYLAAAAAAAAAVISAVIFVLFAKLHLTLLRPHKTVANRWGKQWKQWL